MTDELTKDPASREFYVMVGRCIKRWADIEGLLFSVCHWALKTDERTAAIVFFRTPQLSARVTLTDDLMQARFFPKGKQPGEHAPALLKKWETLKEQIEKNIEFRNVLAHFPSSISIDKLIELGALTGFKADPIDAEPALVNVQHEAERIRRPSKHGKVDIVQMRHHLATILVLKNDLTLFLHDDLKMPLKPPFS
jgi:hypothetical protein